MADTSRLILTNAVTQGDTELTEVTLRKPKGGDLRGLALTDLLRMEVTALQTLLPRITVPPLSGPEVGDLDPADLLAAGQKVIGFFMSEAQMRDEGLI